MTMYYWAESLDDYAADNEADYDKIIEIKRLNFFIGRNNAGKSRFLRAAFSSQSNIDDFTTLNIDSTLSDIADINISNCERAVCSRDGRSSWSSSSRIKCNHTDDKEIINNRIQKIKASSFNQKIYSASIEKFIEEIHTYQNTQTNENPFKENIKILKYAMKGSRLKNFNKKYYIPVLRGMRCFQLYEINSTSVTPYLQRTIDDYFIQGTSASMEEIAKSIVTGEELYESFRQYKNGNDSQWQTVESYEYLLSKYFFDNQTIKLIPKHDDNVLHIKIGNNKQLPIYQLGDGLQQAIILTYEAFIKKDEVHAFFIEEPELHMHAGMVRQLMNFYLNETKHYYFFTTHSNHLLDMVDESDEVIIQKFSKTEDAKFLINRCDKDRDLLASLGVKPSSVYLANCTIWVEGITDRLYLIKYMEKYLKDLANPEQQTKYKRFMPSYHYTFVEYQGGNLVHWNFDNVYKDHADQINAKCLNNEILLIADGDIKGKADREKILRDLFKKECLEILDCKETENTLPFALIIKAAKNRFANMQTKTKTGFDITQLDTITDESFFYSPTDGIGRILDSTIRDMRTNSDKCAFSDPSGTIRKKLEFCRDILKLMDTEEWQMTDSAKMLCEKIFNHIEKCN